jgi:NAD(P)-dependent dehydrogenase (short-subunit alcohol dehydrogenase family)
LVRISIAPRISRAHDSRPGAGDALLSTADLDQRPSGGLMEFRGQAALVVGGTSGLGEATARRLRSEGCEVVLTGRDREKGEQVARELGAVFRPVDVQDSGSIESALDHAGRLASLRFVVHCAGMGHAARTIGRDARYASAHSLEDFRHVVDVNLVGTFNVIRLAASAMARTDPDPQGQRGAMVIASSLAARVGQVGQAAYAASKAGQLGMLLPLARDLAPVGVRVNAITPGGVDTPIYGEDGVDDALRRRISEATIFPARMAVPEEFASLALELLRNDYLNAVTVDLAAGTTQLPR